MAHPNSYPSPTQSQMAEGSHPFYTTQHQASLPDNIDLSSAAQRQGPTTSGSQAQESEIFGSRDAQAPNQFHNVQNSPTDQLMHAANQLPAAQDPNLATPGGKRTKTSRACDQCRSKKTRCDEIPGAEGVQCVGCRRNNQRCEFSREPQKRGPSKGYIKELAERVGALESERSQQDPEIPYANMTPLSHQHHHELPSSYMSTPVEAAYGSRKRTHSSAEGLQTSPFLQDQLHGPIDKGSTAGLDTQYSRNTAGMRPSNQPSSMPQGLDRTAAALEERRTSGPLMHPGDDTSEDAITFYYDFIHPVFPFLPHDRSRLHSNLASVSAITRVAFFAALNQVANPGRFNPVPSKRNDNPYREPANLVADLQHEHSAIQAAAEKLVVLQTVLLMILATDMSGPTVSCHRGWYTQAYGAAAFFFGHLRRIRETGKLLNRGRDEHHLVARRAWLTFVTLEHWHAAGTAFPSLCPDELTDLVADDRVLLGELGYFLLRSSFVLTHIMDAKLWDTAKSTTNIMQWRSLNAEKDRVRESIEVAELGHPYDCLGVILDLFINTHDASDPPYPFSANRATDYAIDLTSMLSAGPTTPAYNMLHHYATLAATTLVEALRSPTRKGEAFIKLQELHQALVDGFITAGDRWTTPLKNFVATNIQHHLSSGPGPNGAPSGPDRAGLQHLADAAVGETEAEMEGESGGRGENEYSTVAPKGYLTMLAKYV